MRKIFVQTMDGKTEIIYGEQLQVIDTSEDFSSSEKLYPKLVITDVINGGKQTIAVFRDWSFWKVESE